MKRKKQRKRELRLLLHFRFRVTQERLKKQSTRSRIHRRDHPRAWHRLGKIGKIRKAIKALKAIKAIKAIKAVKAVKAVGVSPKLSKYNNIIEIEKKIIDFSRQSESRPSAFLKIAIRAT